MGGLYLRKLIRLRFEQNSLITRGKSGGSICVHDNRDNNIVHRDPSYLRLDNEDHLRLSFVRPDGRMGKLLSYFNRERSKVSRWTTSGKRLREPRQQDSGSLRKPPGQIQHSNSGSH